MINLTPEIIDGLEAGRELDALVAERIMGFRWYTAPGSWSNGCSFLHPRKRTKAEGDPSKRCADWARFLPQYSTEWEDAWKVLHIVAPRFYDFGRDNFDGFVYRYFLESIPGKRVFVLAVNGQHAICKAALKLTL